MYPFAIDAMTPMAAMAKRASSIVLAMLIGVCGAVTAATPAPASTLPVLNIDKSDTTVSGISSGGYMAVQLHVAYSSVFAKGVASIAGGPFYCAEGGVVNALVRCLGKAPIPVAALADTTEKWAGEGALDALSHLSKSRVYLFSGANDSAVNEATSVALAQYYERFVPKANIVHKKDIAAEHAFVTDAYGASCLTKAAPFLVNCGFDTAGALLSHLYGGLKPPLARTEKEGGNLVVFEQGKYTDATSLATTGFVYVPESCAKGGKCRIHVALHGCKQNAIEVGDVFARNAGYNRWADANNIVVLYPQTAKAATNGCWDWWGYSDAGYAKKSAPQMKAIVAMVNALAASTVAPAAPAAPTETRKP